MGKMKNRLPQGAIIALLAVTLIFLPGDCHRVRPAAVPLGNLVIVAHQRAQSAAQSAQSRGGN